MINCRPLSEEQTWKPKKLQQIEVDSLKLRAEGALEAHMIPGDKPGQVRRLIIVMMIMTHYNVRSRLR